MAKKKGLLNEATVRRFMGLAGMESNVVSNALKEMYSKRDDEKEDEKKEKKEEEMKEAMYAEEEPAADDESDMGAELGGEMDADEPDMGGEDAEVELTPEDVQKLKDLKSAAEAAGAVVDKLGDAAGGEEADMDMGGEMDAPMDDEAPDAEEEEVIAEALSGINIELTGDDLVQEVTKRVARRLLKAKRAQQALDEALGKKNSTPRPRTNRRRK